MKAIVFLTKIACGLGVLFVLSFCNSSWAADNSQQCQWVPVDQNSFAEILTMIGERVRENHEKIKTWQGKVEIVTDNVDEGAIAERMYSERLRDDGGPIPNKIKEHQEFTREFALDVDKGLLYESYYPDGQNTIIDVEMGRQLQLKEGMHLGSRKFILAPGYHLDCMDNKNPEGVVVGRTVIKQARPEGELTCGSGLPPVYDPRVSMRVFGHPLWETFAKYLAYIDKYGVSSTFQGYTMKLTVEECDIGDVNKYKITLPGVMSGGTEVYMSSALVCSSEAGFNVVSYLETADYDRVLESKTWSYGLIDGVYIPVQTTKVRFDYQTGNLDTESACTFIDQKVNHPISENVFTYENLGLQDGDIFEDRVADKQYIFRNDELVEVEKAAE